MRPQIFNYSDYREYLKAIFAYLKTHRRMSIRRIAKLAGFGSCSYLRMVLSGERNLSERSSIKVAAALKLDSSQASHLIKLVRLAQSPLEIERAEISSEINRKYSYAVHQMSDDEIRKIKALIQELERNRGTIASKKGTNDRHHLLKIVHLQD